MIIDTAAIEKATKERAQREHEAHLAKCRSSVARYTAEAHSVLKSLEPIAARALAATPSEVPALLAQHRAIFARAAAAANNAGPLAASIGMVHDNALSYAINAAATDRLKAKLLEAHQSASPADYLTLSEVPVTV